MANKVSGGYKTVVVKVTQDIINKAQQWDSMHCMIADSVKAALPNAKHVCVDLLTIRFSDPGKRQRYVYLTPRSVQRSLVWFDQGVPQRPFSFHLRKAVQIVPFRSQRMPDGSTKPTSRAIQKAVGGPKDRKGTRPTVLGGELPKRAELSSRASRAKLPGETRAERRAKEVEAVKASVKKLKDDPASLADATVKFTRGRVRVFGMEQMQP